MQEIAAHLARCRECAREWNSLCEMQTALAGLGPVEEPVDLPLRIRVAISQERARSHRSIFTGLILAWKNSVGPFLLQAGAGFASAVLLLGTIVVLVTMFTQPEMAAATPDEPLGDATAPHLLYFSNAQGGNQADVVNINGPVVVEAFINPSGEVYDYRTFPDLRMRRRARRWRACCCSAASLRHASSASRCADWRCCRSPGCRCEGKPGNREQKSPRASACNPAERVCIRARLQPRPLFLEKCLGGFRGAEAPRSLRLGMVCGLASAKP